MNPSPEILAVSGTIITLLLSGNIFFIKRLVDKLERTASAHETTSGEVSQLTVAVSGMGDKLREIKADIKELRRIEIDVAVLRAQVNPAKEPLGQS